MKTFVWLWSFLLIVVVSVQSYQQENFKNYVKITEKNEYREIQSNGIPNHMAGTFPNRNNPNTISQQNHVYRVPINPKVASQITKLGLHPFGVAVNGVPFDPGAAEFWNRDRRSGWQYEAMSGKINLGLDMNNAHVQPGGSYHYHGLPIGLLYKQMKSTGMIFVGYAADGFPIYALYGHSQKDSLRSRVRKMRSSYQLKEGTRQSGPGGKHDGTFIEDYEYVASSGDLDECNGRFGPTPEYPNGIYHYYITQNFPFIPRFFKGTPDDSFMRKGPGGNRPPHMRGGNNERLSRDRDNRPPHHRPPHEQGFNDRDPHRRPPHHRPPRYGDRDSDRPPHHRPPRYDEDGERDRRGPKYEDDESEHRRPRHRREDEEFEEDLEYLEDEDY